MKSALLRGRDHVELGEVDVQSIGPAAIALSVGGAEKTYAHVDPNEDAAGFGLGNAASLVVVADGHHGFESSEVALEYLLANPAPHWTEDAVRPEQWERHATAALCDANREILSERTAVGSGSCTTLSMALFLPEDDRIAFACVGDSHCFLVGEDGAEELGRVGDEPQSFLGRAEWSAEELAPFCRIGSIPRAGGRALVLVTDGISERGIGLADPAAAVSSAVSTSASAEPAVRAGRLARAVAELALASHQSHRSGDNVAAAVLWLVDP